MRIFRLFIFSFLTLTISCSEDEIPADIEVINQATIVVDGKESVIINDQITGNTNCDKIFLRINRFLDDENNGYDLSFDISKQGDLMDAEYLERTGLSGRIPLYLSHSFDPISTMHISNFSYDESTNDIYFEFSGTVFNEIDNTIKRSITGTVDIKNHKDIECSIGLLNKMEYKSNELTFKDRYLQTRRFQNGAQKHIFYSNNGFRLEFDLNQQIGTLELGTYPIVENNFPAFVNLFEYVGPLIAIQSPTIVNADWKKYQTRGTFTITDKIDIDGGVKVKGYLNLDVIENYEVIYTIDGMEFITFGN